MERGFYSDYLTSGDDALATHEQDDETASEMYPVVMPTEHPFFFDLHIQFVQSFKKNVVCAPSGDSDPLSTASHLDMDPKVRLPISKLIIWLVQ